MTKTDTLALAVGSYVYCTVDACAGWYRVVDIRGRDGYIKVGGVATWNPPHNFSLTDRFGRTYDDDGGVR